MTTYRTKRDAKRLSATAKKGDVFYTVVKIATNLAPWEDGRLWQEHKVTHMHPILGSPMIGGTLSVELLVLRDGPVHTTKPAGMRGIHEPAPQVPAPLAGMRKDRPLTANEINMLEARVARDLDARYGRARAKKEAKKIVAEHLAGAR